jgi:hypothetical protein
MWKKHYDYYMDDVYFTNEFEGQVRELRFAFNTCIDITYNSLQDFNDNKNKIEKTTRLAQNYTNYISAKNDIDDTNELEFLLSHADFTFQIPEKFLSK